MADATIAVTYKEDKSLIDKCGHGYKFAVGTVTFDGGNYVVNGISMDLSKIFPNSLDLVIFEPKGGFYYEYDYTNKKIKVFYYDYSNASDGVAIEYVVAAISTAPRFIAIGR